MLNLHIQFAKLKESPTTAYSWKKPACQSGTGWLTAKYLRVEEQWVIKLNEICEVVGQIYLEERGEFMAQGKTEQLTLQGTR